MALTSQERRRREYQDGKYPEANDYDDFGEFINAYGPAGLTRRLETEAEAPAVIGFTRAIGLVLVLLLALRFGISLFTGDVSSLLVASVYTLTNWLVAPFNTLLGIIPTGVSGFVDYPALAGAGAVIIVTTLVNWLIRSVARVA